MTAPSPDITLILAEPRISSSVFLTSAWIQTIKRSGAVVRFILQSPLADLAKLLINKGFVPHFTCRRLPLPAVVPAALIPAGIPFGTRIATHGLCCPKS